MTKGNVVLAVVVGYGLIMLLTGNWGVVVFGGSLVLLGRGLATVLERRFGSPHAR